MQQGVSAYTMAGIENCGFDAVMEDVIEEAQFC
ncbi:MAG: hypothetical protein MAG794_00397 [Gammaproteobacteria bacterium]|nr:hypothetical protein [Gammaproteobacteria bacterium]